MRNYSYIYYIFICACTFMYSPYSFPADKFWGAANNLSNSHVNSVYQDKEGLIWVCTDSGLNVFDGSNFKAYYHQSNDSTSLTNNSVLTVFEDTKGRFWVGTIGGLQLFDRTTEKFTDVHFSYPNITDFSYFRCIMEDSKGNIWLTTSRSGIISIRATSGTPIHYMTTNSNICSNKINILYEDKFGNIWIGSQDNGISVLNVDNHTLVNYHHNPADPNSLSSNKVFSITELPGGNMLIGTIDGGIDLFDYKTREFTRNYIPIEGMVFTMMTDRKNNLWIGTDGHGMKYYDAEEKKLNTYETELPSLDMRKAKAHSILEDKQGNIWIGLYQKGVLMTPPQERSFGNVSFNPFYPNKSIGTECVLSILEDRQGNIWIGTDGDGIYKLNSRKEVIKHYPIRINGQDTESVVLSMFEDSNGRIWIGTYLSGMFVYEPARDSFEKRELIVNERTVKHINTISQNPDGNLWLGTNEDGVCIYNPESREISSLQYNLLKNSEQVLSNTIHTITFGKNRKVWIGTSGAGLSCYDLSTNSFSDFTVENDMLTNNNINTVTEDSNGNIWVGTTQGLNCICITDYKTTCYTERDGLPHSTINGIEIDEKGNLWISTNFGLSHFDVHNKSFNNYFMTDGMVNNEFRRGAHFHSQKGEMYFGGINGITYFHLFEKTVHPLLNLIFTDIYIYNKPLKAGEDGIITQALNYTDRINLSYDVKSFSIGFTALEYNTPDDVIYQVKMEGFDNDWKTLPLSNRLSTYTNLKHGKYIFNVKASLPGMEAIERSISIFIRPPFWLTWWAKLIYACIFLLLMYYTYKTVNNRIKTRKEALVKQNENQIMQSKLQFFTDISHEIRTPLTLILTPIEQLIKETPEGKLRNTYKLISQNGHRVLRLVNQVMEMRRLDKGQVKLSAERTEVSTFFESIISSFDYIAKEKSIDLRLDIKKDIVPVWMDQEKIDKVIFNVLSNAFKYTPNNGNILIEVDMTESDLVVRIIDSGIGIPPEMRESVFDRFYQIPNDSNRNKMGTGIGLHLSRSLMNIHHGRIYVEDSKIGAIFVITLPLDNSYLKPSERKEEHSERNLTTILQPSVNEVVEEVPTLPSTPPRTKYKYKVLIVEDDENIRNYLFEVLCSDYQLIAAENGNIGLELAIKELPDCVITDVMMPVMDGTEMCNKLKNNDKTSHIPVIMLTAKTSIEHRIEGLQAGADSYLPKPFSIDHLKVRINKLIELRRVIKNKYGDKTQNNLQDTTQIKSFDEKFLEKLETIVREKIADSDLSVETISEMIGISRSQLQRKLKQLTNQNPSEYIKITRLKYAAQLLASKKLTISEVTYAAGFSSLSHFSNSFKEHYGMSPTRYMEINNEE